MSIKDKITGPLSVAEIDALSEIAAATTAHAALEVGHYLGLSTAVLLSSLPPSCSLVTIDHHGGDDWCPATSFDEFMLNVSGYVGERRFTALNQGMSEALPTLLGRFGFCFYDADHREQPVREFWQLAEPLLDDTCTLVFDDADWDEQSVLRELAEADGFRSLTGREFWRGDGDKNHPDTYTLEVMRRA